MIKILNSASVQDGVAQFKNLSKITNPIPCPIPCQRQNGLIGQCFTVELVENFLGKVEKRTIIVLYLFLRE